MHKINYQPVPYSFNGDKRFAQQISSEKFSNQVQTNQPSDTSDLMEMHFKESMKTDINYSSLIKSMREEVEYQKEALKTAQSLISNYQKENLNLKEQNTQIKEQLRKVNIKLENVQRLLFKLFQFEKSHSNSPSKKSTINQSSEQYLQSLETFGRQNESEPDLYKKIQKIYERQILYQEQILSLNNKIKLLQKSHHSDMKTLHKSKIKNSVYLPFTCTEVLSDQKVKIANKFIQVYADQQNIRTLQNFNKPMNKHSQFKKNLEKQFQMFLQKTKTSKKTKASLSKIPYSINTKSSHSVSVSLQKKNSTKRSTSIPKK